MDQTKLLLVDDLEENLLALEAVLQREGIELIRARSGSSALELLLRNDFALAIIDVHMPDMTGFELAELMRGTDRTRRIPIIFLTAGVPDQNRQFRGYESGAVDFLYKPFDPQILVSKVNVFIELARQRQEIIRQRDAIEEHKERLRIALETAELSIWDWDISRSEIRWPEQLAGQTTAPRVAQVDSAERFFQRVHPADLPQLEQAVARCLASGEHLHTQFRLTCDDGSVRWVLWMAKLARNTGGQPVRLMGVQRDITKDKESEQELRSLSDNSPNVIARFDRLRRHVFVSRSIERITGSAVSDFIGKTNRELGMPDELCTLWDNAIDHVFETGNPISIEFGYDAVAGPVRMQSNLVAETRHSEGIDYVLSVTRDMTAEWNALRDLERAKLAAESANAAKDRFLAVLSHELRNPLAPIRMLTTLWEMEDRLPPEYREGLDMIRRNVDLECRLIDDMLDINRIAQGKLELRYESVDVNDLIRNVMEIVRPDCDRKQISLHLKATAAATTIRADAARVQQVLWNLLNNAIKFTPHGGRVELRSSNPMPDWLRLEVTDTGIGIDPAKVPVIFDAFEQGDQSITREFGGLGLGLAISKAIAELHGGRMIAASPGRHQGATFALEIETESRPNKAAVQADAIKQPTHSDQAASLHILLVEDQRAFAKLTERLLQKIGHRVTLASSIAEARRSSKANRFDLIISDFGLPDGDGCQLLSQLDGGLEVPAIALTGFGMEEDIRRAIDSGYRLHLTKPVSFEQLVTAIGSVQSSHP